MKPTIGRIVHYTNLGDHDGKHPLEILAAIITRLNEDGTVSLKVFYNTWVGDVHDAQFSETPLARGCWNWPPREP